MDCTSCYHPTVCGVLAALFIAVPIVEIWLILQIGGLLGVVPTVAIIVVTAVTGAALARHQGFAALRQLQDALARGRRIGRALAEAALVLAAGITLLTPGFFTDAVGLAILVPPVRGFLAARLVRHLERRADFEPLHPRGGNGRDRPPRERGEEDEDPPPPGVIDV